MTDVFVRCMPKTDLRRFLCEAVLMRWMEEKDIRLHVIGVADTSEQIFCPVEVALPEEEFAWESRKYAERRSNGDYILADDDHFILGADWVKRLTDVAASVRGKAFSILGARSVVLTERVDPSTHANCDEWAGILKYWCVGTPCLIRRGVIPYHQLSGAASQQDTLIADAMKKHNLGFVRGLEYNHLGYNYSQVTPSLWNKP